MFSVCEKNAGGNEGSLPKRVYRSADFFFFFSPKKISKLVTAVLHLGMSFLYLAFVADNSQ